MGDTAPSEIGRYSRQALAFAGGVAVADLLTKEAIQQTFRYGERVEVTSFFNVVFVLNPGAAFSILANAGGWQKHVLLAFGFGVAVVLAFWLIRKPMSRVSAFGCASVLGGAVGNIIDRARRGAVVDWLDVHFAGWHWPAFNVADVAITLGAAALILDGLVKGRANTS